MRRKKPEEIEPVVPQEILEQAKLSVSPDRVSPAVKKCAVCSDDVAPNSPEDLCWVCRRLKISAWRDSDQQMPVQE